MQRASLENSPEVARERVNGDWNTGADGIHGDTPATPSRRKRVAKLNLAFGCKDVQSELAKPQQSAQLNKDTELARAEASASPSSREAEEVTQDALALWLAAVRAGHLRLGDKVPDSWRDGLHYVRDKSNSFSNGDTVVVTRSNGERRIATVEKLQKENAVELLVGASEGGTTFLGWQVGGSP